MKIGIITFHRPCNYGAALQATALYKKISMLNKECEIIDYENEKLKSTYNITELKDARGIKSILKAIMFNGKNKVKYNNFKIFINESCKLSKKNYSKEDIVNANEEYEKFITGSDQVWNLNLTGEDYNYFLEFVKDNNKKFSYASSFGYSEIPSEYKENCKLMFEKYSKITVREQRGKQIIQELINKNVDVVLDPTLLLNKSEWKDMEKEYTKRLPKKYILAYFVSPTKEDYNFVKKLSKKLKLKIVLINYGNKEKFGMKNISKAGPAEFLWFFRNSEYVVTNSFHGVAFSINYNKEFFYKLSNKAKNGNSRIENIINICDLSSRNVNIIDINNIQRIDWKNVNSKLEKERENSIEHLKEIIK